MSRWTPDAGDVIWISFAPEVGREQAGHRPAVVLSPRSYNGLTGLLVCVPMTTKPKGYPFEVEIAGEPSSVALADHVKSVDWRGRGARPKGRISREELLSIQGIVKELIG